MKRDRLTYDQKQKMIDFLLQKANVVGGKPLTIAIFDDSRELVSLTLMDGMPVRSAHLASNKAYTSALMHRPTKEWRAFMEQQGVGLEAFGDSRMTYLPGGAPIFNGDGDLLGAIGISGWTMDEDQQLADEAVALLGR